MYKKFDLQQRRPKAIPYPRTAPPLMEKLAEAEENLAQYLGVPHAVIVHHPAAALWLALKALDMVENSELMLPAIGAPWLASTCEAAGLRLNFADVDPHTHTMAPQQFKDRINARTAGVIVPSLFGHPAHWLDLNEAASAHHLKLVEVAVDALGGVYRGQKAGTLGDISVVGFHYASGAAIITRDSRIRESLLALRNGGWDEVSDDLQEPSLVTLPTPQQVADIMQLLKDIDDYLEVRYSVVKDYQERIGDLPHVSFPPPIVTATHTFRQLVVTVENAKLREKAVAAITKQGFSARPGIRFYPTVGRFEKRYHYNAGLFPHAKKFYDTAISLPLDVPRGSVLPEAVAKAFA